MPFTHYWKIYNSIRMQNTLRMDTRCTWTRDWALAEIIMDNE